MSSDIFDSTIQSCLPAAAMGDQVAYGRIVRSCQGMVTSIAWSIVRDIPASEDIAQDAFLSAWQNLRKLGNPQSFLPWLRQITRNLARDHLRAQGYRANPAIDIEAVIAAAADPDPSPDDALAESQEAAIAAEVIGTLAEESREILLLYYREGQSSRQVAALLGMQDAAVRKRLSRARQEIRAELLQRLGTFARRTAPGSAFTAMVVSSLTLASPPAAAASALVVGGAFAGKSLLKVLIGTLGSVAIGVAGGLAGVWLGSRKLIADSIDEREQHALRRYRLAMSLLVVGFAVALVAGSAIPGWQFPATVGIVYVVAVMAMSTLWMPRILARRRRIEEQRDPVGFARKQRREKALGWLGCVTGLLMGGSALVYGLISSGRL